MKVPYKGTDTKAGSNKPAPTAKATTGKVPAKATAETLAKDSRQMVGFGFQSPGVVFVISHNIHSRVILVDDTTPLQDVRSRVAECVKVKTLFIVSRARNLEKLGPKTAGIGNMMVAVHDDCEILAALPNIKVVDATSNPDGSWSALEHNPKMEDIQTEISSSRYRPIHPDKVRNVLESSRVVVPDYSKGFNPAAALATLFKSVEEGHREKLQHAVYQFMCGMTSRRSFAAVKRSAVLKLAPNVERASFEKLLVTIQQWIEDPDRGRRVTAAYQLFAKKKVDTATVAAARADADHGVLTALINFIPPSKKMAFEVNVSLA